MNSNRLDFIDIAKGLTILWVVWMHMEMPMHIWACFQMPFFFFISGTLYKQPSINNRKDWIKRKAKSLLIPGITFFCISLVIILLKFGNIEGTNIFWKMHHIGEASIIWFLEAMFLYLCIHYGITKWVKWKYSGIFIALVFYPIGYYMNITKADNIIPCLYLSPILLFWIYFELGCFWGMNYKIVTEKNKIRLQSIFAIFSIIFAIIVCTPTLNYVCFRKIFGGENFLIPIYIMIYNLCMTYLVVLFSYRISGLYISQLWKFYGVNSLVVYLAHWPIYSYFFKPLIMEGMNKYLAFASVIVLVTICIYFFNKYCPILIGKNK